MSGEPWLPAAAEQPHEPQPSATHSLLLAYLVGLLTATLFLGTAIFFWRRPEAAPIQLLPPPTATLTAVPTSTPTPAPIVVDVGGAVRQPGVLLLPPGARVVDAVAAAGGLTAEADALQLNQAARLFDGAQVYVPALGASSALPPAGLSGTPSTPASDSPQPARGLVDLNTATQAELEALPGIGATKAQAILANRPYATVAELDRVPGIGSATIQQLQEWVVVGP